MKISRIIARQILDSRGNPTVEADVWIDTDVFGRAAVPSGASTGEHEAHELRDGGKHYNGKAVTKAVKNVNSKINEALRDMDAADQKSIDKKLIELDGTENRSKLGANATLAVSLAIAHAAAKVQNKLLYAHINELAGKPDMTMPLPMMNVLNGGRHATHSSDFQEFMIIPSGQKSFADCVRVGSEIFQMLKSIINGGGYSTAVGDEGGFTFPVNNNAEMLELLELAVKSAEYDIGKDVVFAMDVAASEFYQDGRYKLMKENRQLTNNHMNEYLQQLAARFPIVSIEDGLDQDDWEGWTEQTRLLKDTQLVGDDLLVTNVERLQKAIDKRAGNAILIKPNQVGTLTETLDAILLAKENGWNTIVSHRSGETEDTTIAHLAVGTGAGQIKTGSMSRGERTAKYNELLRIEEIDSSLKLAQPF